MARRRRFVGRTEELGVLSKALKTGEPAVLFIHGPGGVGKTALLYQFGQLAAEGDRVAVRVNGRLIEPTPAAFSEALGVRPAGRRAVILIDTFEDLSPLDAWVREEFIPGLPADSTVVIAGRTPPSEDWIADPGWAGLLQVVQLGSLSAEDIATYAASVGLPESLHDRLATMSRGHALAVTLLADLLRQRPEVDLADAPDLVSRLVRCFTADTPSDRHRQALQACALTRCTTEPLLYDVIGTDAPELFDWLCDLPFVEQGPGGIWPHDLVRDVICADLRWRDPAGLASLHGRIRAHLLARIRTASGREQTRWVTDISFLARDHPAIRRYWDWSRLGTAYAEWAHPTDHKAIVAMVERHEGPESAACAARLIGHPAALLTAFRATRGGDLLGFSLVLRLHEMSEADLAADPGTRAAWAHVQTCGPLRPADQVTMARFFMDGTEHHRPSASLNTAMARHSQRLLASPDMALDFICSYPASPERTALMAHIGYQRIPEADYRTGATSYAAYLLDWRGRTPQAWADMMGERETGMAIRAAESLTAVREAMSRQQFSQAVRIALRHLHAPDQFAVGPLLQTHLAATLDGDALRQLVIDTILRVADDPRAQRPFRALDRTYLRPAQTQEQAAEILGLPFSTYRRHLTQGITRVTDTLWRLEQTHHSS